MTPNNCWLFVTPLTHRKSHNVPCENVSRSTVYTLSQNLLCVKRHHHHSIALTCSSYNEKRFILRSFSLNDDDEKGPFYMFFKMLFYKSEIDGTM
jgi:hypothetical protein